MKNLIIRSLQNEHLSGKGDRVYFFYRILLLVSNCRWESHEDVFCVVISAWEAVKNIASINAVVLTQPPLKALIKEFIIKDWLHLILSKGFQRFA